MPYKRWQNERKGARIAGTDATRAGVAARANRLPPPGNPSDTLQQ
jgi:hypothetical protein